jgi:hypothetical protein
MRRLIFYGYDQISVGGVQNLFVNFCIELARRQIFSILICKETSYVYQKLNGFSDYIIIVNTSRVLEKEWGNFVSSNDVLLLANFTSNLRPFLKINPFIVFWSVLPTVFRKANDLFFFSLEKRTIKLLNYLGMNKGIIIMDQSCIDAIHLDFNYKIENPKFLPVPTLIPNKKTASLTEHNIKSKMIISYLGRGEAIWKIRPVIKIMKDLINAKLDINIEFIIITNTNRLFEVELKKMDLSDITINYKYDLTGERLYQFFLQNIDLSFGMGTSALESAKLGIPTILVDASYKEFPDDYKYIWLHDTINYSLGTFIDFYPNNNKGKSMKEIIYEFQRTNVSLSKEALRYVRESHSISDVTNMLLNYAVTTESKLRNFNRYVYRQKAFFQFFRLLKKKFISL